MATTSTPTERVTIPLDGRSAARVRLSFGGGELTIGPAEPGMLISGTFEGGVIERSTGPGSLELEPLSPGRPLVTWRPVRWNVGVTSEIPVDLRLDTGANRSVVDLASLRIRQLELHTGASETNVQLPSAGQTSVRVQCGFAAVNLQVPAGVAARVRGRIAIGSTEVDELRFPRSGEAWESVDFQTALDRVDISVEGAFGSVRVR
jgi:hypothetical protein